MTVAQNLFLGQEQFYNRLRGIYIAAQQFLQSLNFDVTPTATVGAARRRQEADGRDRARRAARGQGHHLRRADRHADAGGEEIFLRPGARPQAPRRVDRVHLARAGGGADPRRPHHHPARRQACRDRRRRQVRPRAHRAGDGRARPVEHALRHAQDHGAAGRRAGADGAEPENGADGEEQFAFGVRRTDHRRVRPGRRRPHRDVQDRRRRPQARFLPRRRGDPARQAGALPRARAGGAGRHRLCHRGPQGRGLLRDHVGRPQHLSRAARQVARRPVLPVAARGRQGRQHAGSRSSRSAPPATT